MRFEYAKGILLRSYMSKPNTNHEEINLCIHMITKLNVELWRSGNKDFTFIFSLIRDALEAIQQELETLKSKNIE